MFDHLDPKEANLSPTASSFGSLMLVVAEKILQCVKKLSAGSSDFGENK